MVVAGASWESADWSRKCHSMEPLPAQHQLGSERKNTRDIFSQRRPPSSEAGITLAPDYLDKADPGRLLLLLLLCGRQLLSN